MKRIRLLLKSYGVALLIISCNYSELFGEDYETTLYTPNGETVAAWIQDEFTPAQIAYGDSVGDYLASLYCDPGSWTPVASTSRKYNCHAYAFHVSEGGNWAWINSPDQETYWTDGDHDVNNVASYVSVTEANASHISYVGEDHSARQVTYDSQNPNNSIYESKWGSLGVYRHKKGQDPYPNEYGYDPYHFKYTHQGNINYNTKWVDDITVTGHSTVSSGMALTVQNGITISLNANTSLRTTNGTVPVSGAAINGANAFAKQGYTIKGYFGSVEDALAWAPSGYTVQMYSYTPAADLTVNSGVTLEIANGSTISMNSAKEIRVCGKLIASNVTFTYNGAGYPGAWYAINLYGATEASSITNCTIRYAIYGIYNYSDANHTISGCNIANCAIGILGYLGGPLTISNCTIQPTSYEGIWLGYNSGTSQISDCVIQNSPGNGIYCRQSSADIWESRIKYNSGIGLYIYDNADVNLNPDADKYETMIYDNGGSEVRCEYYSDAILGNSSVFQGTTANVIKHSTGYLLEALNNSTVLAEKIWWGSSSNPYDRFSINNSTVDYEPWSQTEPDWTGKMAGGQTAHDKGMELIYRGDYGESIQYFEEQIELFPNSREAHLAIAQLAMLHRRGRLDGNFLEYLDKICNSYESLKTHALELAAIELAKKKYFGDVIDIYEYLLMKEDATDVIKQRAFDFYLLSMGYIDKAEEILSDMTDLNSAESRRSREILERMRDNVVPYTGALERQNAFELDKQGKEGIGEGTIPHEYDLHPVYPNPFNPTTTISFDLPEQTKVTVAIYNVLGQRVATIINNVLPAGNHRQVWYAARFGSGIYFVRMTAGDYTKIIKITLLR